MRAVMMMSLEKTPICLAAGCLPDHAEMAATVESLHANVAGLGGQDHKQGLNHDHGTVDDDTEVDGSHRQQVGTHVVQIETDKGKEQRQRDDARHDDRRAPVFHEEKHDKGDEKDTLQDIVEDGVHG